MASGHYVMASRRAMVRPRMPREQQFKKLGLDLTSRGRPQVSATSAAPACAEAVERACPNAAHRHPYTAGPAVLQGSPLSRPDRRTARRAAPRLPGAPARPRGTSCPPCCRSGSSVSAWRQLRRWRSAPELGAAQAPHLELGAHKGRALARLDVQEFCAAAVSSAWLGGSSSSATGGTRLQVLPVTL